MGSKQRGVKEFQNPSNHWIVIIACSLCWIWMSLKRLGTAKSLGPLVFFIDIFLSSISEKGTQFWDTPIDIYLPVLDVQPKAPTNVSGDSWDEFEVHRRTVSGALCMIIPAWNLINVCVHLDSPIPLSIEDRTHISTTGSAFILVLKWIRQKQHAIDDDPTDVRCRHRESWRDKQKQFHHGVLRFLYPAVAPVVSQLCKWDYIIIWWWCWYFCLAFVPCC